jgi:hypothetical protein
MGFDDVLHLTWTDALLTGFNQQAARPDANQSRSDKQAGETKSRGNDCICNSVTTAHSACVSKQARTALHRIHFGIISFALVCIRTDYSV